MDEIHVSYFPFWDRYLQMFREAELTKVQSGTLLWMMMEYQFEDKEPETGICYTLDGMRMICIRMDKPLGPKGIQLGEAEQYTVWVKSDVPICACFGRLDVRQTNMAFYTTSGYSL